MVARYEKPRENESERIGIDRVLSLLQTPENQRFLDDAGARIQRDAKGNIIFLHKLTGEPQPVAMKDVVRLEKKSLITTPVSLVVGIYMPDFATIRREILENNPLLILRPAELKIQIQEKVYRQAISDRDELISESPISYDQLNSPPNMNVAVISKAQIAAWQEGILTDLPAVDGNALPPRHIVDSLFYDKEGERNGPLAQVGLDYRIRTSLVAGIDVLLCQEDENGILMPKGTGVWGLDRNQNPKKPRVPRAYKNTVGFISLPPDVPLSEIKKRVRVAEARLRAWYPELRDPKVIPVDEEVLAMWQTNGPLVASDDVASMREGLSPQKRFKIGFERDNQSITDVSLKIFKPQENQIGAKPMKVSARVERIKEDSAIAEKQRGVIYEVTVDGGLPNLGTTDIQEARALASTVGALMDRGIVPRERSTYDLTSLTRSLSHDTSPQTRKLIIKEIFHRLGESDAIKSEYPDDLPTQAQMDETYWDKEIKLYLHTHEHTDHWDQLNEAVVRSDIPRGMSLLSVPLYYAMRAKLTNPPETPIIVFSDGQRYPFGPFDIRGHDMNHSLPGPMSYEVALKNQYGNTQHTTVFLGDYTVGEKTETAFGRFDYPNLIVTEGTNFGREKLRNIDRSGLRDNLFKLRQKADNTHGIMILQMSPNNLDRLEDILEVMKVNTENKRKTYVTPNIAKVLHTFAMYLKRLPKELVNDIDIPVLGRDVFIVGEDRDKYQWEQDLIDRYGITPMKEIGEHPQDATVVYAQYNHLSTLMAGIDHMNGYVVRSCSRPYAFFDIGNATGDKNKAKDLGMEYLADFKVINGYVATTDEVQWHVSGHASAQDIVRLLAEIVRPSPHIKPKTPEQKVIVTHCDNEEGMAHYIKTEMWNKYGKEIVVEVPRKGTSQQTIYSAS